MMKLVEEGGIPATALPVAELRAHLRLGTGFAEDSLQDGVLEGFLRAAVAAIEGRTSKALIARDFRLTVTHWRDASAQVLPVAPVSAVLALALVDAAGNETLADPAGWWLEADAHCPALRARAGALPSIPAAGVAEIRFTAGYGSSLAEAPADLRQAVMMLAAHYYEHREDTALGRGCMPFGVTALTERFRPVRLTAGGRA